MEDDKGLDLSLSLPYGGKSTSFKVKNQIWPEVKAEDAHRGSKLIDDFKNFLDGGTQNEDYDAGSQRSNKVKPEENLFYDLSNSTINGKRKKLFDEINHQKRYEREPYLVDLLDKRTIRPHMSITKDEGSVAGNEDFADFEAEGSTSKLVQHREDKEVSGVSKSVSTNMQGIRRFPDTSGKDNPKVGNMSYGVPLAGQSVNMLNMMAPACNDRPGTLQPVIPATLPLMFGYSRMQTPSLEPVNALKPSEEGSSSHTTITSGIAAELKFGGSGLSPDLPWVSTTGGGPNGKTISGVTYKHDSRTLVVCACHGSHMSYEEFMQHASEEQPNPNNGGSGPASVPNSNPAASAQLNL